MNETELSCFGAIVPRRQGREIKVACLISPAHPCFAGVCVRQSYSGSRDDSPFRGVDRANGGKHRLRGLRLCSRFLCRKQGRLRLLSGGSERKGGAQSITQKYCLRESAIQNLIAGRYDRISANSIFSFDASVRGLGGETARPQEHSSSAARQKGAKRHGNTESARNFHMRVNLLITIRDARCVQPTR